MLALDVMVLGDQLLELVDGIALIGRVGDRVVPRVASPADILPSRASDAIRADADSPCGKVPITDRETTRCGWWPACATW